MKVLVLLFACVALVSALSKPFGLRHGLPPPPPADRQARPAVWLTFTTYQDNFDHENNEIWNMRYIANTQFHTPGAPIFIMLGAEWTIGPEYLQGGLMFDMARTHGGAMFYTEHRYYGQSFPVVDLSTNNLRYLSTEQALEDVAEFIRYLKRSVDYRDSKVVVVGGSYGASMAIWMRAKYPDLVHAAWSSSAPVLAKVHFFGMWIYAVAQFPLTYDNVNSFMVEYSEVVSQSLSACTDIVRNGIDEVQRLLQTNDGIQKVSHDFDICRTLDVNNFGDTSYFYMTISDKFAGEVQYGTTASLDALCNRLKDPTLASDYDRLVAYYRTSSPSGCVEDYNHLVALHTRTGLDTGNGRQWIYQTCTEFGYFQTSASPNQPFAGIPIDWYLMWCKDFFGPEFTEQLVHDGVNAKNERYGGLNPEVTRVISTHGTYDPWHVLGLTHDVNSDAPVIIIPNASHCADLRSISASDAQPMIDAKMRIYNTIAKWLAQ